MPFAKLATQVRSYQIVLKPVGLIELYIIKTIRGEGLANYTPTHSRF